MSDTKAVVLAVDDTPANLDLLNGILGEEYNIKVATSGKKAMELAVREPLPDIILLDIMMPGMSGYEVCRALKQSAETTPIPVIFVTAMSQVKDEQAGLALGAVDYITKPYDHEIVKARVRAHLNNYQQTRELIRENRELRDGKARSFTDFDEQSLIVLLESGEGQLLEFKSTLRWNLFADRSDKAIENSSLKTVAGYLNSDGGVLLIGVNDDAEIIGLNNDHFKTEDKFLLHWVNLLKSYLGAEYIPFIRSIAHNVNGKRLLVVECLPSTKPAFVKRDNDESFFVRMSNTTQALKPSEVLAYIEQHFASGTAQQNRANTSQDQVVKAEVSTVHSVVSGTDAGTEEGRSGGGSFSAWIDELKKRRVIRTAVFYVVVAWGFTEIATTIAETLEAPVWLPRALVYGFIGGFPLVVILSWIYDMRLIKSQVVPSSSNKTRTIWLVAVLILISVVAIGFSAFFPNFS